MLPSKPAGLLRAVGAGATLPQNMIECTPSTPSAFKSSSPHSRAASPESTSCSSSWKSDSRDVDATAVAAGPSATAASTATARTAPRRRTPQTGFPAEGKANGACGPVQTARTNARPPGMTTVAVK